MASRSNVDEMIAIRCSALLFDLDGVLIDSTPAVARVWHQWAVDHGFDPAKVIRVAHGRPSRTTIRELLPNADIDYEDGEVERREMEDLDGVVLLQVRGNSLTPCLEIAGPLRPHARDGWPRCVCEPRACPFQRT